MAMCSFASYLSNCIFDRHFPKQVKEKEIKTRSTLPEKNRYSFQGFFLEFHFRRQFECFTMTQLGKGGGLSSGYDDGTQVPGESKEKPISPISMA